MTTENLGDKYKIVDFQRIRIAMATKYTTHIQELAFLEGAQYSAGVYHKTRSWDRFFAMDISSANARWWIGDTLAAILYLDGSWKCNATDPLPLSPSVFRSRRNRAGRYRFRESCTWFSATRSAVAMKVGFCATMRLVPLRQYFGKHG